MVKYDEAQADYGLESDEDVIYYPEGEGIPEGDPLCIKSLMALLTICSRGRRRRDRPGIVTFTA